MNVSSATPLTSPNTGWQGQLDLRFTIDRHHQRTHLARSYARAPLKVQRPFYPEPQVCHTVLLHTAGGMVGGDHLSSHITLEPQTQALITTAAAAKIYRSNGSLARQEIQIDIAAQASLEWLPQETIIFDRAAYHQSLHINLAAGGTWCGWDITRLGRSASGEQFNAGEWRSEIAVWQAGKPLWIDRQQLLANSAQWSSLHGLAHQPIVGTLAILGTTLETQFIEQVRSLWTGSESGLVWGVSHLRGGLICRYRGSDRQAVRQWFMAVWDLWRQNYSGRSACLPRVWQT